MIKPSKLVIGDTVAFVSLSAAHPVLFPKRLERAVKFFSSEGYKVKLGKSMGLNRAGKSGTIEERVEDFQAQFIDKEVKAIISASGGYFCNELIGNLDYALIRRNPKLFCGYSDNTLISAALLNRAGLTSLYGPCVIPEFGEHPFPLEYTWINFKLAAEGKIGNIIPSEEHTEELLNWVEDPKVARKLKNNRGYEWVHQGNAEGNLVGGCLNSLRSLGGTNFDFDYKGAILFLDIPEGDILGVGMPPPRIDSALTDFELRGILDSIGGLIFGRLFRQSSESEKRIKEALYQKTRRLGIPVLYGADITHGDPMTTVPVGVKSRINSSNSSFSILEQGVLDEK